MNGARGPVEASELLPSGGRSVFGALIDTSCRSEGARGC